MNNDKTTFALFFGNRGFFPASLQSVARQELTAVLHKLGHKTIAMNPKATRYGAVETPAEGEQYAEFLRQHRDKFGGVILCLPNFGDETGAVAALKDAGVPILIQAYPDTLDKMAPEFRRDAFCGKLSIMDVFCQYGVNFTALKPHTVHPSDAAFAEAIDYFDRLCRVVKGMSGLVVGAIGARTTPFKTVRIDEVALQRHGITMETIDLSEVFARIKALKDNDPAVRAKAKRLKAYMSWQATPAAVLPKLAKLGVVFDQLIVEFGLQALAVRCWIEMQKQLGISPCVLLSEMNERGITAACEVDVGNAATMQALHLASGMPAACLDWNNNYADDETKCILFHCGALARSLMTEPGRIIDHAILANAVGKGRGYGAHTGRIAPTPFTFGSMLTEGGRLKFYLGQGRFTDDVVPREFFGCAGVAEIDGLQDVLQTIGYQGHRHHVSVTPGHIINPVAEAFEKYLGYELTRV